MTRHLKERVRRRCVSDNPPTKYYLEHQKPVSLQLSNHVGTVSCCEIPVLMVNKTNSGAAYSKQQFVYLNKVGFQQGQDERIRPHDHVYITCCQGHVLRGHTMSRGASWSKCNDPTDPRTHFEIRTLTSDSEFLSSTDSFELWSVRWSDYRLGRVNKKTPSTSLSRLLNCGPENIVLCKRKKNSTAPLCLMAVPLAIVPHATRSMSLAPTVLLEDML